VASGSWIEKSKDPHKQRRLEWGTQREAEAKAPSLWAAVFTGLKRPLKKSQSSAPRGLKSARRVKSDGLIGTTEVVP